ncbi:PREDICTED: 14 kDa proline-rich protein DC2.15-like [Fragaria vesca subsp. vesca]|uniref:14 kDa proline-rich protein DC2.15-like n=1 Tax=Fragaria vesca subsp. vesca TaxID=101020 RepID=UPI0002C2E873|nr:PREDICTED: 14 kDa proline-rich protein DC2.15-like [Fragaria vesca subsp. vesca]
MDSKRCSTIALFLSINLLLSALTSGCYTCSQPHPITTPKPITNPIPGAAKSCPRDTLKLGVCAKLLNGAVGAVVGSPPDTPCCAVLEGLVDLEVAVCLCTAIKANILGINLNIPVSLSLLLDGCAKKFPSGFQCA